MANNDDDGRDPDRMLKHYLHDYLVKKKLHKTAEIFRREANVPDDPVGLVPELFSAMESPEGFLKDWWCLFMDVYLSSQETHEGTNRNELVQDGKFTGTGNAMLSQQVASTLPASMFGSYQQIMPPIRNITPYHEIIDVPNLEIPNPGSSSSSDRSQEFLYHYLQSLSRRNTTSFGGHSNSPFYGVSRTSPGPSGSNLTPASSRATNTAHQEAVKRVMGSYLQHLRGAAKSGGRTLPSHRVNTAQGGLWSNSQQNMPSESLPQLSGNHLCTLPATPDNQNPMLPKTDLSPSLSSTKGKRSNSGNGNNTMDVDVEEPGKDAADNMVNESIPFTNFNPSSSSGPK